MRDIAISTLAILAALLLARGLKWIFVDGKPRIDRDTDYEPHVKAWPRITTDEEQT